MVDPWHYGHSPAPNVSHPWGSHHQRPGHPPARGVGHHWGPGHPPARGVGHDGGPGHPPAMGMGHHRGRVIIEDLVIHLQRGWVVHAMTNFLIPPILCRCTYKHIGIQNSTEGEHACISHSAFLTPTHAHTYTYNIYTHAYTQQIYT